MSVKPSSDRNALPLSSTTDERDAAAGEARGDRVRCPHCRRVAGMPGAGTGHPLTALPVLIAAAEPLACRLSTQQLVELLKDPSCVGKARRVVLDFLGQRYQRHFADLWQFVDYAHEHLPDIDLTTPPKRPQN